MGNQITLTKWQKWSAALVMLFFAAPNVYYAAIGNEDFPYTCAPMFAHYIGKDTRFYNFKFIAEYPNGEKILPPNIGTMGELRAMRFFFSKVYGSSEEISPFGDHLNDTPRQFEERLARYFRQYLKDLPEEEKANLPNLKQLRLEVWRFDAKDQVDLKHVVGYYSPTTEKFTHVWKNP